MEIRIDINEKFLGSFATGTLAGTLLMKHPEFYGATERKLILVFHTSSLTYCQKHNGPRSMVMCDYVPMCLVQDIIKLQNMGIVVSIEEIKED